MIEFNCSYAESKSIGEEHGLNIEEKFNEYKEKIAEIIVNLNSMKDKPQKWLQWMNLGYSEETVWYVKEYASLIKGKFDNILVLGIGGSALGGMAVCEALLKPFWNFLSKEQRNSYPKIFFLDNIDPDLINSMLTFLDLKKTLTIVITKSGSTAETMSQFMIIKDRLESELGESYGENLVAVTDAQMGVLRQLADQEGYKTFVVPDDVSGRFSVFSAVGLLLFALVGIDIDSMVSGIKNIDLQLKNTDIHNNIAAQNALIHYLMDIEKNKKISVLMPYSSKLKYIADWYAHLCAESLGRAYNKNGDKVNTGFTPVKAMGVTDQHSQLQLYCEGPHDKIITFIRVGKFDTILEIPNVFDYTGISYLGSKTMNTLMDAEADSTVAVLVENECPVITITLPEITPYYIGQLLYFFEIQISIIGELYNIDAFSQPLTEPVKDYMYGLMGRDGYEESAKNAIEKITIKVS